MSEMTMERLRDNLESLKMKNTLETLDNYLERAVKCHAAHYGRQERQKEKTRKDKETTRRPRNDSKRSIERQDERLGNISN
jgi:archaellum component FlaC